VKNILIEDGAYLPALEKLKELPGVAVEVIPPIAAFGDEPRTLPATLLADTHILFSTDPPANLDDAPNLELLQIGSVGFTQLYGLDLPQRGIKACNARGVFDPTIAEWNIAMMINCLRDVRGMIRNGEHGIWDRDARFQRELRGLTVGIWGYGGIGRATARLAKAFGLKVHVLARNGVAAREETYLVPETGDPEGILPDKVFIAGQEHEFLAELDFLILSVPQTPQTIGMIGEAELKRLKPTAYVLNPARGPLIQEEALLKALRESWIAGAALDTHYYYPMPADHPLWRFPNVIMTPHVSGSDSSPHYQERVWDIFVQNVQRHLAGEPLLNELTPAQLGGS
jgi:phosphoglycerate dehydrogenase-like enzyme